MNVIYPVDNFNLVLTRKVDDIIEEHRSTFNFFDRLLLPMPQNFLLQISLLLG